MSVCMLKSKWDVDANIYDFRDRDWQKWPVTIITGAYIGWVIGHLAGRYVFHGKVVDLSG